MSDLRRYGKVRKVCEIYADEQTGWRGYYADQWRWRKADPEYDRMVKEIIGEGSGGRPPKDGGDDSWKQAFADALIESYWSFEKAAAATPYSVRQLVEKLDPSSSSYDEDFFRIVEGAEMVLASKAREIIVREGLGEDGWKDFDQSKITSQRVWTAIKALEKLEKRFSKRHVEVTGTVQHQHQHRMMPPPERLQLLWEDRKQFMATRRQQALAAGELYREAELVVEAMPDEDEKP